MMAVGDVQRRYILENISDTIVHLPVADHPQPMPETVLGRKVVIGRIGLHHIRHQLVDLGIVGIGEEDRFDIGLLPAHMLHAILLLVGTRQFVLLDRTALVIAEMTTHRQSVLRAPLHRLGIDVVMFLLVLPQPTPFAPQAKVLDGLVIDLFGMLIGDRVEVDFGFDDVQQRTFACFGFRLGRIEHVIGTRRHLGGILLRRTNAAERFDSYHSV